MHHAWGRCRRCGERLYARIDGGYGCANCGATYSAEYFDGSDDGGRAELVLV